jgi:putative ABC transport system substrate-binding protein
MRRRKFLALLGGAAAGPMTARAQQGTIPVIGFLSSRSPSESAHLIAAFKAGLADAGYVEGRNLIIAFRWAEGRYDRLPVLAADLVNLRVAVLLAAGGPPSAVAAKAASTTTPIVFSGVNDAVELGLVASLNRPGGNMTGMSIFTAELAAKNVELLKELVPAASVIGYLVNQTSPSAKINEAAVASAEKTLGVAVRTVYASTEQELENVFSALARLGAVGLVVPGEPFFDSHRERLVALAAANSVPTIYSFREYAAAGGLMSYGADLANSYRQAGVYCSRILKGERPSDLPVQQPTKFELVINFKAAKALGLPVPATLMARADEVIE